MKTKSLFATLFLLASFALVAQEEAVYELKSGIIHKTIEMGVQKMTSTYYFDDYGKVGSTAINMATPQGIIRMRTILKDGTVTVMNLDNKTGQKSVIPEAEQSVNFLKLTDEVREKNKIKELGEEEILGKKCKKYAMQSTTLGMPVTATVWVWKGLTLKSTSTFNEMTMTETATEIEENADVATSNFTVPEGVVIQEQKQEQKQEQE